MQKKPAAVIMPCRKKPTVETPEDLTNVATLEDYEKAAANLAAPDSVSGALPIEETLKLLGRFKSRSIW